MLYYDIRDYEDFKSLFPIREEGGVSRRVNKVLLSLYKSKAHLHQLRLKKENRKYDGYYVILPDRGWTLSGIEDSMWRELSAGVSAPAEGAWWDFFGRAIIVPNMKADNYKGLCTDNDENSIRYLNKDDKVYKMKAGKFIRKCLEANKALCRLPEQIKVYFCEEFARQWKAYAAPLQQKSLKLVVDDDFEAIYDRYRYVCNFGSCMQNCGQWTFYRDAVKAKAASLRNEEGKIMARCVIFAEVKDEDTGEILRLAERQYGQNEVYKQMLVDMLIKGDYIDGYKDIGASCWDRNDYRSNSGASWQDRAFSIACDLDAGDTLSFQDSFSNYDLSCRRAYNYGSGDYDLAVTDSTFQEDGQWSEYYNEYIPNDDAVWSDYHNSYMWRDCVVWSERENDYLHGDIAIYVETRDDYYLECDADLVRAADLDDEWCDCEDCTYSELLEANYYSESKMVSDEEKYAAEHNLVRDEYGEWVDAPEEEEEVEA